MEFELLDERDESLKHHPKAVILHGFSPAQIKAFVSAYRANGALPQNAAFAVPTEQSVKRPLGDVLNGILEDAEEARKRKRKPKRVRRKPRLL